MKTTKQRIENIEKELAELKIQLQEESKEISAKEFLLGVLGNELTIKIDREKYPNSVFYFKGKNCLLELQKSEDNINLWCNYNEIWNPISAKYSLDYALIQELIKETVEEHFKMRDVTPGDMMCTAAVEVEEHFKMKDVTPE